MPRIAADGIAVVQTTEDRLHHLVTAWKMYFSMNKMKLEVFQPQALQNHKQQQ